MLQLEVSLVALEACALLLVAARVTNWQQRMVRVVCELREAERDGIRADDAGGNGKEASPLVDHLQRVRSIRVVRVLAQGLIKREHLVGATKGDAIDILSDAGVPWLILQQLLLLFLILDGDDSVDGLVRAYSGATLLVLLIVNELHLVLVLVRRQHRLIIVARAFPRTTITSEHDCLTYSAIKQVHA